MGLLQKNTYLKLKMAREDGWMDGNLKMIIIMKHHQNLKDVLF